MPVKPVVEAPVPMQWGCAQCRTIHKNGFGITVTIDGMRSLVGDPRLFTCCNEERRTPLIYSTEEGARLAGIQATLLIPVYGNCDFLLLIPHGSH